MLVLINTSHVLFIFSRVNFWVHRSVIQHNTDYSTRCWSLSKISINGHMDGLGNTVVALESAVPKAKTCIQREVNNLLQQIIPHTCIPLFSYIFFTSVISNRILRFSPIDSIVTNLYLILLSVLSVSCPLWCGGWAEAIKPQEGIVWGNISSWKGIYN